ncbi:hypothetical protein C5C30_16840 [Rathayibacter sp. AY2B5]|nr:hypothetical protein C5C30_16840 [Rathayibacter sp. AY2B5]
MSWRSVPAMRDTVSAIFAARRSASTAVEIDGAPPSSCTEEGSSPARVSRVGWSRRERAPSTRRTGSARRPAIGATERASGKLVPVATKTFS